VSKTEGTEKKPKLHILHPSLKKTIHKQTGTFVLMTNHNFGNVYEAKENIVCGDHM
jgi:hypothetical protein